MKDLQGLANQPEGSGRLAGGNDVILSVAYPEAGGDVNNGTGYPDMVTNTVNTSANVFDNTQDGKQNHPWAPTNIITSVTHATASSGATTITAPLGQVVDLRKGSTFIQHSSTSVTDLSNAMTITSGGGTTFRWTSGLQIGDVSTANGIRIVSSNNVYETSVAITFDSDNNDSGTIVFGSAQSELTTLTAFYPVFIVDGVTSNHTVDVIDGDTGVITFEPALIGTLDSPTVFITEAVYVTNDNGLEDIRYYEDNKLLAGATYQGAFNDNNGFNVSYLRGVNVSSLNNGNGSFTIPRLYTDNNDISGTQINDYFVYRRRNGFRPAFRNIAFNDGEVVEAIQFDPILDPYWESNTVEGIKVFTDAIDGVKNGLDTGVEISGGTVSIETVPNNTGLPNDHNTIYRRIELADNEQLVTGTKTSYSGRASKFSRVFDLDNPVQGNLSVLNPNIGLTLLVRDDLFKGTGAAASTINGYNVGDNECEIDVAGTRTLQMDIEGNTGGTGIRLTQGGSAFLSLSDSTWSAESVSSAITNNLLSSNITTIGDQTYQGGCLLGNTTLTTAAGDITCDAALQGTTSTIDLDAGTLTASGVTSFIVQSMIDVDTVAMGSTFLLNDSTMITNFITGGALTMENNSRLEIFNDATLSGTLDDSTIITDGNLTATGDTTAMTINGFDGNEVISLSGVSINDIVENIGNISISANTTGSRFGTLNNPAGSITFSAGISVLDTDAYSGGTITLPNTVGSTDNGSNSTFNASTISQPQTTGNSITRCNLTGTSVTVTNATDCIMDGTTTNIVIGDSVRNLWLHDGRVNPGAGVTTPTSTEDTITVNGVDLRLTGNITDLRVGSGIRAGYIATLNNFIDGIVDCEQLFVDKNITGSTIDTYQLNSTDFPGNDTITSNITIGKLLSTDADQPTSVIEDNVSSTISLRHNTYLILEGTQEASTAASISGPTDSNTAEVQFGTPVEGGFLTDITILNAAVSDSVDWSPLSFDNVDIDATNEGRIRFNSTGDVEILRGPQPTGTVSDFDQSSSALQAWKEDSPGFVNLDWIGALAVAPIAISEVATANGYSYLIVDQKQAGGSIWKLIKGTETSEADVFNVRAEVYATAQTDVSISNGSGSDVIITTPAAFGAAPTGAGTTTTPTVENGLLEYYASSPWNIVLPISPFDIIITKPGLGRLEVEYRSVGGVDEYKVSESGSTANITLDETEVAPNTTVTWTYSFASEGTGVFGIGSTTISNVNETIQPNPQSGLYSASSTGTGTFVSVSFDGTKLNLVGNDLNMVRTPEAKLSQIWLEGIAYDTSTSIVEANLAPLHRMMRLQSNTTFFGFETAIFRYVSTLVTFDSTSAIADAEEVLSFMRSTDQPSVQPQVASNNATPSEFVSITQLPLVVSAAEIGSIVIEDVEKSLNDLTNDVLGDVAFGIPPEEPYPGSGSLK